MFYNEKVYLDCDLVFPQYSFFFVVVVFVCFFDKLLFGLCRDEAAHA